MRIAQAAALTGLSPRQIRYHQERGELAGGDRARGRHREFTDRDVRRLTSLRILQAAGVAAPLAARAVDGRLTPQENAEVDQRLEGHSALTHQVRTRLGHGPATAPDGQPDISLMFDIFVLRTRMGEALTRALTEAGVTATEYALLSLLVEAGSRTAAELARLLGTAPTTLGSQLSVLVRRGWVTRSVDPRDRRRVVVTLTRQGAGRFRAALPHAARLATELDRALRAGGTDPGDARALLQTLSATLGPPDTLTA